MVGFYHDGSNFGWRTSIDGVNWSSFNAYGAYAPGKISIWYDEANNKICLARCRGSDGNGAYYRQGTANSNGTITWDSAEVTIQNSEQAYEINVCKDSNGYPWVAYLRSPGYYERVVKATATNGSSWGSPVTLWTNRASGAEDIKIVPLTGGKMLALSCMTSGKIQSRLYHDTTWDSAVDASSSNSERSWSFDAVNDGNNVFLVFLKDVSDDIILVKYTYGTGWGSEETVESSTLIWYHPSITKKASDDVRVFYFTSQTTIKYRDRTSGSWNDAVTISSSESGMTCSVASYKEYSNKFCVIFDSVSDSTRYVKCSTYTLLETYTKTYQSDVLFKKLGITKTAPIDAAFKKLDITATAAIDALFKKIIEKTFGLDSTFLKSVIKQKPVDALFKKLGITETFMIDSLLKKQDVQIQKQVDLLFKKINILKTFGVDVDFLRNDIIKSFAIDVRFGAVTIYTISKQIDALFKKRGISKTFGLDAWFGTVGAVTYAKTFGLDVVFRYKVRLPTPLGITLNGQLVFPLKKEVWMGEYQ